MHTSINNIDRLSFDRLVISTIVSYNHNGNNGCIWSGVLWCVEHITSLYMQKWTTFIRENHSIKEKKQMSKILMLSVVILKTIAECTENQGSWPRAHVVYFFTKVETLNVYINWSMTIFFWFTTGQTRGTLYTALFWWCKVT